MTSIPQFKTGFSRASRTSAATTAPAGNREKWLLPIAIVVAAIVGLAGWMLLVSPLRDDASAADAQTTSVSSQVDTLRRQVANLESDKANLPKYQAELKAAQAALPTTAALPVFLRTLQDLGTATGTVVTGLNATEPDGSSGATTAGSGTVGTVYSVPMTVIVTGPASNLVAFVKAMQDVQPRAVLVDTANMTSATGGKATVTLSMTAFVAPTAGATTNGG